MIGPFIKTYEFSLSVKTKDYIPTPGEFCTQKKTGLITNENFFFEKILSKIVFPRISAEKIWGENLKNKNEENGGGKVFGP